MFEEVADVKISNQTVQPSPTRQNHTCPDKSHIILFFSLFVLSVIKNQRSETETERSHTVISTHTHTHTDRLYCVVC